MDKQQPQAPIPPQIHMVTGSNHETVVFGKVQIEWLLERGEVEKVEGVNPEINSYRSEKTHMELHKLVWAQPELRECDFCRQPRAPWVIQCAPFQIDLGPHSGSPLGGTDRPLVACNNCEDLIRGNRKNALVEYAVQKVIESADREGGHLRAVVRSNAPSTLRAAILPQIRAVVYGMFANRRGFPEKG